MKKLPKYLSLLPLMAIIMTGCNQSKPTSESSSQSDSRPTSLVVSYDDSIPEECEEQHTLQDNEFFFQLAASNNPNRNVYNIYVPFSDNYFTSDSKVYNQDLSILSYAASCLTESRNDLKRFFDRLGFDNQYASSSYLIAPTQDTIGYYFAHKTIGNDEVIAVVARGFGYGKEWANNFQMGEDGNHYGFNMRVSDVLEDLDYYISNNYNDSSIKIWTTGYSRGGAISNMLAAKVIAERKYDVDENKMYAYTFEAPRGLTKQNAVAYKSVFNIVNHGDVVPKVAPEQFDLYRCGIDIDIYQENIGELLHRYDHGLKLPSFKTSAGKYDTPDLYADYVINSVTRELDDEEASMHTREDFFQNYEATIQYTMNMVFSLNGSTMSKLTDALTSNIMKILLTEDALYETVKPILDEANYPYDDHELRFHCRQLHKLINGPANNIKYDLLGNNMSWMLCQHYPDINYVLLKNYAK